MYTKVSETSYEDAAYQYLPSFKIFSWYGIGKYVKLSQNLEK